VDSLLDRLEAKAKMMKQGYSASQMRSYFNPSASSLVEAKYKPS